MVGDVEPGGGQAVARLVGDALTLRGNAAQHPEAIASTLAAGLKETNELIEKVASSDLTADSKYDVTHELRVKQAQFENALAESLGISLLA